MANILGVRFHNLSLAEVVSYVGKCVVNKQRAILAFSNPEFVVEAQSNPFLMDYLNNRVAVNVADGIGVVWAAGLSGQVLKERVTGTDFVPSLMRMCAEHDHKIFFLGGKPGVAEQARDYFSRTLGKDVVVGVENGYFSEDRNGDIVEKINSSGAQVLMVCLGNPRQEKWIEKNLEILAPYVMFGNGGALDFWSGGVRRAPLWVQKVGFEWVFRLGQDFSLARIRRQLKLLKFVKLFLQSMLFRSAK